jgi:hypothetical protein
LDMNPWLYLEDADGPKKEIDALRYTKINHFIFENNQVRLFSRLKAIFRVRQLDIDSLFMGY